jgi:hypothetical protein
MSILDHVAQLLKNHNGRPARIWRTRLAKMWPFNTSQDNDGSLLFSAETARSILNKKYSPQTDAANLLKRVAFLSFLIAGPYAGLFLYISTMQYSFFASTDFTIARLLTSWLSLTGILSFYGLLITLPASLAIGKSKSNKLRATAAMQLGILGTPKDVSSLASAANDASSLVSNQACASLSKIISNFSDQDKIGFEGETISSLCCLLKHHHEKLVLEVLEVLRVTQYSSAIRTVEYLAQKGYTDNIKKAANDILPILYNKRKTEKDRMSLMRPSTNDNEAQYYTLLRPTEGVIQTQSDHLLRINVSDCELAQDGSHGKGSQDASQ